MFLNPDWKYENSIGFTVSSCGKEKEAAGVKNGRKESFLFSRRTLILRTSVFLFDKSQEYGVSIFKADYELDIKKL